jgi:VWFA-related protein
MKLASVALISVCLSPFLPVSAQDLVSEPDGAYRVNVHLVSIDAQVVDKKTHQVLGSLSREDLEVYEDGVRQSISAFSQDELPLSVVLLFDLTDSVRPVLKPLAEGARKALEHLKPEDQVAVMVYSSTAKVIQDFTTDREVAAQAIKKASRMESGEAAFFNEAIFQAAAQLTRSPATLSRRVIIWLTDDVPNIPSEEVRFYHGRDLGKAPLHTEKQALEQLYHTGAVVCTLLKKSEISDWEDSRRDSMKIIGRMMYPPGEAAKYAQVSGGEVVESSSKKLPERLAILIDDLRLRYSLGYRPSVRQPQGKFCTIKVKLAPDARKSNRHAVVEAREGYYR